MKGISVTGRAHITPTKTLEGNTIRTHQFISIISMSPIAIPFDNIAHSQQPHQKKSPFSSIQGKNDRRRSLHNQKNKTARECAIPSISSHACCILDLPSPSSGHRFATYATENPETRSQL